MQTRVENWHVRSCWSFYFFFLFILCTNASSAPMSWEALHKLCGNRTLWARLVWKLLRYTSTEVNYLRPGELCSLVTNNLQGRKMAGQKGFLKDEEFWEEPREMARMVTAEERRMGIDEKCRGVTMASLSSLAEEWWANEGWGWKQVEALL